MWREIADAAEDAADAQAALASLLRAPCAALSAALASPPSNHSPSDRASDDP